MTIPNILTCLRIILVPCLFWCILNGLNIWAFVVVAIAGMSDFLDGFLARKLKQSSRIGGLLDPFADKFFGAFALLALCLTDVIPWFLFWIFLTRDLFLVLASIVLLWQKKQLMAESKVGKLSTGAFVLGLALILLDIPYAIYLFYAGLILYLLSGVFFFIRIFQSTEAGEIREKARAYILETKRRVSDPADPPEEKKNGTEG